MKLTNSIFILLISFILAGCASMVQEDIGSNLGNDEKITFNGKNYSCTFYDDFSSSDLDLKRWSRCPEWQRQDLGGFWKDECSYIEDRKLVIEGRKKDNLLISGGVRTREKFEQTRGLYKIRFKAEKASGLWFAFWLMGDTVSKIGNGAIDGGEIDIFEILPNDPNKPVGKKNYLNSAIHWDGYGKEHKSFGSQYFIDDSFYNEWHEVTFEWTKDYYKAYLDNNPEPYFDSTIAGAEKWGGIVNARNYIKITAEFGTWGGKVDEEKLPAKLYVDWVKAYKEY